MNLVKKKYFYSDAQKLITARCSSIQTNSQVRIIFSADIFDIANNEERYIGSFRASVNQLNNANSFLGQIEKSSFLNVVVGNKIKITGNAANIFVEVTDSSNTVRYKFNASEKSGNLREISILYEKQRNLDEQSKIAEIESIDLRNYLKHTLKSALNAASIDITIEEPNQPLNEALVGNDNIWSSTELLSALRTREDKLRELGQWSVWLFEGSAFTRSGVLGTLITTSSEPYLRRRGCAVFTGLITGVKQDRERARLRTTIHELGHCLNLTHTDSRANEIDNAPCFMDPGYFLSESYWNSFPFQFNQDSIQDLHHAFYDEICPGKSPFKDPYFVFQTTYASAFSALELSLEVDETIFMSEPLLIKLSARNVSGSRIAIDDSLAPEWGKCQISISRGKDSKIYCPIFKHCGKPEKVFLKPGESLNQFVWLHSNEQGTFFNKPGKYKVSARWKAFEDCACSTSEQLVTVLNSVPALNAFVAKNFLDPKLGELFEVDGSRCTSFKNQMEQIHEVASRWPKSQIGKKCSALAGMSVNKNFKSCGKDGILVIERNLDQAIDLFKTVFEEKNDTNQTLIAQFSNDRVAKMLRTVDFDEACQIRQGIHGKK